MRVILYDEYIFVVYKPESCIFMFSQIQIGTFFFQFYAGKSCIPELVPAKSLPWPLSTPLTYTNYRPPPHPTERIRETYILPVKTEV